MVQDDHVESADTKSALPAMSLLPATSVTALLATQLLGDRSEQRGSGDRTCPLANATACASVLASAPWAPQGKWQPALTRLVDCAATPGGAQQLRAQLTAVNMILRHGQHAGTGMHGWLAQRISARGWAALPAAVQTYLCLHAASLLPQLPTAAAAQLVDRLKEVACGEGGSCAPQQCAACLGLNTALRDHRPLHAASNASDADPVRSALLGALEAAIIGGPAMPRAWQQPHASLEMPPGDAHWRLTCDAGELANESTASEAAIRAAQRSCWQPGAEGAEAAAKPAHLLDDWACGREPCEVPSRSSGEQLAQWAWCALCCAVQAEHCQHTRLLDTLLSSQRDTGSARHEQGCRAIALGALCAVERPGERRDVLAHSAVALSSAVSGDSGGQIADSSAPDAWWAACCTVAAAISQQEVTAQCAMVTDLLRTTRATASSLREQLRTVQTAACTTALAPLQQLLSFGGVIVWEVARTMCLEGALAETMPHSVRCPLSDPDGTALSGTAAPEQAQWAAASSLSHTLPALLQHEAWRQDSAKILRLIFSLWQGSAALVETCLAANGQVGALEHTLRALREALYSCWVRLLPEERAALLPGLLDVGSPGCGTKAP